MSLLSRRHHNHSGKSDMTWPKRSGDFSSPDYSEHIRALSFSLLPLEPILFPHWLSLDTEPLQRSHHRDDPEFVNLALRLTIRVHGFCPLLTDQHSNSDIEIMTLINKQQRWWQQLDCIWAKCSIQLEKCCCASWSYPGYSQYSLPLLIIKISQLLRSITAVSSWEYPVCCPLYSYRI